MIGDRRNKLVHSGGVYIAVLGTSLIVALLGLTALVGQRIQNRLVVASADIRQAQLNANTAVELALLTMRQDANWRANQTNGPWFTDRGTGAGTCSLHVTDPLDSSLSNDPDDAVVVEGIGYRGAAEQRVRLTVDPRTQPLSSLRSALAAGDTIDLNSDTLRTDGLITADQISAVGSVVYGEVEAVTVSGATYFGTTTQIDSAKLPTMPNWATVFDYYRTNGTEISITSSTMPNVGRNIDIENGDAYWTGSPPGIPPAQVSQSNNYKRSGVYSLRVQNRTGWQAGAAQRIDHVVKPAQTYYVELWVMLPVLSLTQDFRLSLHTKGTADAGPQSVGINASVLNLLSLSWAKLSGTLTAPSWTGDLEYAFVKIAGANSGNTSEFYADDLIVRDTTTGKMIFRKVLSPSINPFGAQTNPQGIYWINCAGSRLTIERSRILGTLLLVNPGPGSSVASGPIHWSPAVAGYPALLVDADDPTAADFTIQATNRVLSESEQDFNYNPAGAPHEQFDPREDADKNDIYQSSIRGLVAVEGDLMFHGRPLIRGQVLVGGNVSNSSGALEIEYQPDSLLNPPPGFLGPYSHQRRPASARKAVLP